MQFLASAGMLADVTESAKELGFTPDKTYEALQPALFYDGRQYAFPRNPAQTNNEFAPGHEVWPWAMPYADT